MTSTEVGVLEYSSTAPLGSSQNLSNRLSVNSPVDSPAASRHSSVSRGDSHPEATEEASLHPGTTRRPSFGLNFLSSFTSSIRAHPTQPQNQPQAQTQSPNHGPDQIPHPSQSPRQSQPRGETPSTESAGAGNGTNGHFMANSPTIANFGSYNLTQDSCEDSHDVDVTMVPGATPDPVPGTAGDVAVASHEPVPAAAVDPSHPIAEEPASKAADADVQPPVKDKDGYFTVRLTPLIDHSSSNSGLYFAPVIRKAKGGQPIRIGRYTEKNKAAAHAPQGLDAPVVFKSKVVSRTHAMLQCNEEGQWFVKDCKSSSGTFLNHVRLSPASQESLFMPLIDGDILQLGMDYRGGTEEVYRCVKMRCEFNKSWQRKVNQFNLEIHQKLKNLSLQQLPENPVANALNTEELSECAICLLKLEPCQALFISPCSHLWHYKCIRPIIIKSYPQFYCPNCRSMCDLETDIEDDD